MADCSLYDVILVLSQCMKAETLQLIPTSLINLIIVLVVVACNKISLTSRFCFYLFKYLPRVQR